MLTAIRFKSAVAAATSCIAAVCSSVELATFCTPAETYPAELLILYIWLFTCSILPAPLVALPEILWADAATSLALAATWSIVEAISSTVAAFSVVAAEVCSA
jgi:hypothetical protein